MEFQKKRFWDLLTFSGVSYHPGDCAATICQNDELSSSWLDCLQTDSEAFILSAEINQILLKISFIPNLLTFMHSTL